jgi:hypothetical protein
MLAVMGFVKNRGNSNKAAQITKSLAHTKKVFLYIRLESVWLPEKNFTTTLAKRL